MSMTKKNIRGKYKRIRSHIPVRKKQEYSEIICQDIYEYIHQNKSDGYIALFAGTADEPHLFPLLEHKKWKWCFPKVLDWKNHATHSMEFFAVESLADLSPNSFGILEPRASCMHISPKNIDLVCVPGVSMDMYGNRIGMGGGFYDAFFSRSISPTVAGVVFPEQVSEDSFLPDKWDTLMDIIFCGERKDSSLFF